MVVSTFNMFSEFLSNCLMMFDHLFDCFCYVEELLPIACGSGISMAP